MKANDKLVFISDKCETFNFINGKTYIVNEMINNGRVFSLNNEENEIIYFNSLYITKFFVTLKEYRKQKLIKLNK
jgi:hypothetical protein